MSKLKSYKVLGATLALAVVIGVAGLGVSSQAGASAVPEEKDVAITGQAIDKASAAALTHTGQGRVTDTEVSDEESYYEVEVTLSDNSQVDVQLDETFNFVSQKVDNEKE